MTLSCVILRNGQAVGPQWTRNGETIALDDPNYEIVLNTTLNANTNLVIMDIPLDDHNTEYSCSDTGGNINSAVTLNVTGTVILLCMLLHMYK